MKTTATLVLSAIGLAALALPAEAGTMRFTVETQIPATPDIAVVSMGVDVRGQTAASALSEANRRVQAMMDTLHAAGVADKDIKTANFSVSPILEYPKNNYDGRNAIIRGYGVQNMLLVTIHNIDQAGDLLDKVVSSGANDLRGIDFNVSNPDQYIDQARKQAISEARHRAQVYAESGGLTLKGLKELDESSSMSRPMDAMPKMMATAAAPAPVPVSPGQDMLSLTINATFEFDDAK